MNDSANNLSHDEFTKFAKKTLGEILEILKRGCGPVSNSPDVFKNYLIDLVKLIQDKYQKEQDGYNDVETILNSGKKFAYYDVLDLISSQLDAFGIEKSDYGEVTPKLVNLSYTYTEFITDLLIGREIEFFYKGKKYSITNAPGKAIFSEYHGDYRVYSKTEELIEKTLIEEKTLKDIWKDIRIDCIF